MTKAQALKAGVMAALAAYDPEADGYLVEGDATEQEQAAALANWLKATIDDEATAAGCTVDDDGTVLADSAAVTSTDPETAGEEAEATAYEIARARQTGTTVEQLRREAALAEMPPLQTGHPFHEDGWDDQ